MWTVNRNVAALKSEEKAPTEQRDILMYYCMEVCPQTGSLKNLTPLTPYCKYPLEPCENIMQSVHNKLLVYGVSSMLVCVLSVNVKLTELLRIIHTIFTHTQDSLLDSTISSTYLSSLSTVIYFG